MIAVDNFIKGVGRCTIILSYSGRINYMTMRTKIAVRGVTYDC